MTVYRARPDVAVFVDENDLIVTCDRCGRSFPTPFQTGTAVYLVSCGGQLGEHSFSDVPLVH